MAVYHTKKNVKAMVNGLSFVKERLGDEAFHSIFKVLITDRGSEFSDAQGLEELVENVFYCDPMASWQKPHVENNHLLLRYICPKEKDLNQFGLKSQADLDLIFFHVNSYPWEERHGKSPIDEFVFYYPKANSVLDSLHIKCIEKDSVILTPLLIKK